MIAVGAQCPVGRAVQLGIGRLSGDQRASGQWRHQAPLQPSRPYLHGRRDAAARARGDRIIVRLPIIGRVEEAYCIWVTEERANFQFERIIRLDDSRP